MGCVRVPAEILCSSDLLFICPFLISAPTFHDEHNSGFGFNEAGHTPSILRSIISTFRNVTPGGAYIMAGIPAYWRTSEGDADRNPEFLNIWLNEVDAISPWTIGRYSSEYEADRLEESTMRGDSELLRKRVDEGFRKIDYVPVVFPGGSVSHPSSFSFFTLSISIVIGV